MAKLRRIPQPPIDPQRRATEARTLWLGLLVAVVGIVILVTSLIHTLPVASGSSGRSSEPAVVQAVTADAFAAIAQGDQKAPLKIDPQKINNDCPT